MTDEWNRLVKAAKDPAAYWEERAANAEADVKSLQTEMDEMAIACDAEVNKLRAENERLRALLDRDRLVMVMRDGVEDLVDQIIDMHNVPPLGDDGE